MQQPDSVVVSYCERPVVTRLVRCECRHLRGTKRWRPAAGHLRLVICGWRWPIARATFDRCLPAPRFPMG